MHYFRYNRINCATMESHTHQLFFEGFDVKKMLHLDCNEIKKTKKFPTPSILNGEWIRLSVFFFLFFHSSSNRCHRCLMNFFLCFAWLSDWMSFLFNGYCFQHFKHLSFIQYEWMNCEMMVNKKKTIVSSSLSWWSIESGIIL